MSEGDLYRLAAFASAPGGGNPAGVWVGEALPSAEVMQRIAAEVGYSETAFVAPDRGRRRTLRYFSPELEVPFCGHATIATGVVLGRTAGEGAYELDTPAGLVPLTVERRDDGTLVAALRSVEPRHVPADDATVSEALRVLDWTSEDLDPAIPPARAYAGAWHLVLAARGEERLSSLDYDFAALKAWMLRENLTTLQLVWRENPRLFHARNPFPVGGVVEDPATGAAAAALGGYLRDAGLARAPFDFLVRQGDAMGRPSVLTVVVPEEGGVLVRGTAVEM